jgi:actin related protein 2/3 complex, subunit 5
MSQINYRTINVDSLDPEAPINFPLDTLLPGNLPPPTTSSAAAGVATQIRQLLRGGDSEGALRHVLDTAPLAGDDRAKEVHLATVVEVLQGIRQGEMTRVLEGVCSGDEGSERADCLMKYLYVTLPNLVLHMSFLSSSLFRNILGEKKGAAELISPSYKGMASSSSGAGAPPSTRKAMSPQSTGFSQIQSRNFGEGGGGQQMSVLLSWHEKLVDLTGYGSIVRVMTDRRTV